MKKVTPASSKTKSGKPGPAAKPKPGQAMMVPATPDQPMMMMAPATPGQQMMMAPGTPGEPTMMAPDTQGQPMMMMAPATPGQPMMMMAPATPGQPMMMMAPATPGQPMMMAPAKPGQPTAPPRANKNTNAVSQSPLGGGLMPRRLSDVADPYSPDFKPRRHSTHATVDEGEGEENDEDDDEDSVDKVVEESKAWTGEGEHLRRIHLEADGFDYSDGYIAGFRQFKYLAGFLLRFPFNYRRTNDGEQYEFYWQECPAYAYYVTSIFFFVVTVLYTFNILSVILNFPQIGDGKLTKWNIRADEMFIFYRNSAMAVMFGMLLLHVCVANWKTYRRRNYISQYFGYCANALDLMKIYAAQGLSSYIFFLNLGLVSFILVMIALMAVRLSPITSGGPGFVGVLMVRLAYPLIYRHAIAYKVLQIFAQVLLVYLLLAAKLYVILFIYQCKVIQGAFHLWNQRLDLVLNRGDNFLVLGDRMGRRTSFRELFHDHSVLLDLLDGADLIFADTIESYFACQVLSMIFEMYWFWRCLAGDEFNSVRKLDAIFILVYLIHSLVFLLLASFSAAAVAEEGMDGLEVLRRKGMFGRKSPEELYFLMSLYVSYSGHYDIALTGGGYSNIDRGFLVAVGGTILSYFIVLIQFSHPLALSENDPLKLLVRNEDKLIRSVESTMAWFGDSLTMLNETEYPTLFNLTQLM